MNTKVWYLPYFKDIYHTRMIETFANANASMVRMVHNFILTGIYIYNIYAYNICRPQSQGLSRHTQTHRQMEEKKSKKSKKKKNRSAQASSIHGDSSSAHHVSLPNALHSTPNGVLKQSSNISDLVPGIHVHGDTSSSHQASRPDPRGSSSNGYIPNENRPTEEEQQEEEDPPLFFVYSCNFTISISLSLSSKPYYLVGSWSLFNYNALPLIIFYIFNKTQSLHEFLSQL